MNFQPLFRVSRFLTLVMLILIPLQIIIFLIAPPPDSVKGFFELFHQNPFLGLLSLDFLYLINNSILVLIYLALSVILFGENPSIVLISLALGLIGIACYFPSNPAFEMMTLSNNYFTSSPDQQIMFLSAGENLMAGYSGTSFNVYYVLSTICLLLFSYTIIKSNKFKKSVGYWGLISGFFMIIPSSAGLIGMMFSLLSLIPWVVFIALLRIHFKKFSQHSQS